MYIFWGRAFWEKVGKEAPVLLKWNEQEAEQQELFWYQSIRCQASKAKVWALDFFLRKQEALGGV